MGARRRHEVQAGVIRSKPSLRDKLIVPNVEVAIRSFREADRPKLMEEWLSMGRARS